MNIVLKEMHLQALHGWRIGTKGNLSSFRCRNSPLRDAEHFQNVPESYELSQYVSKSHAVYRSYHIKQGDLCKASFSPLKRKGSEGVMSPCFSIHITFTLP